MYIYIYIYIYINANITPFYSIASSNYFNFVIFMIIFDFIAKLIDGLISIFKKTLVVDRFCLQADSKSRNISPPHRQTQLSLFTGGHKTKINTHICSKGIRNSRSPTSLPLVTERPTHNSRKEPAFWLQTKRIENTNDSRQLYTALKTGPTE